MLQDTNPKPMTVPDLESKYLMFGYVGPLGVQGVLNAHRVLLLFLLLHGEVAAPAGCLLGLVYFKL